MPNYASLWHCIIQKVICRAKSSSCQIVYRLLQLRIGLFFNGVWASSRNRGIFLAFWLTVLTPIIRLIIAEVTVTSVTHWTPSPSQGYKKCLVLWIEFLSPLPHDLYNLSIPLCRGYLRLHFMSNFYEAECHGWGRKHKKKITLLFITPTTPVLGFQKIVGY